jgi:Uma2 family endonuclease
MARLFSVTAQNLPYLLELSVKSVGLTDEQFFLLCRDNPELRFELTAQKGLIIMPPTGSRTGWRNSELNYQLVQWAKADGTGLTFDSSTGFTLPDGAKRSPDGAWVRRERWEALSEEEQDEFAPLCPDFVLELRSPQDRLSTLQDKMSEYIENGAQLGLLIDPRARRAYIYRPGQPVESLDNPDSIRGDPVMPGFVLNLAGIW